MSEDRKQLRNLAERATPGPWELQTSNSWRRIGTAGGRGANGNVLAPTNHRGDNHPDLDARQEDLDFIVAADPSTVLGLLDEIAILRAQSERLAYEARFARTWAEMTVRKEVGRAESEGLAYKMESDQLKAEKAALLSALQETNHCLVACLTGGEVSAKRTGKSIEAAALAIEQAVSKEQL